MTYNHVPLFRIIAAVSDVKQILRECNHVLTWRISAFKGLACALTQRCPVHGAGRQAMKYTPVPDTIDIFGFPNRVLHLTQHQMIDICVHFFGECRWLEVKTLIFLFGQPLFLYD